MDWRFACYDLTDDGGALVRELFPNPEVLPPFVKEAQAPTEELPSDHWALTYADGMHSMRKFAMVDRGNVWLSTMYFTRTGHNLPEPLRKLAARRLEDACETYGLRAPEELHQLAAGEDVRAAAPEGFEKVAHAIQQQREEEAYSGYEEEVEADFDAPLEKVAATTPVDPDSFARGMQMRGPYMDTHTREWAFEQLEKIAMSPPALLAFVNHLDQESGMFQHWGSGIPDPVTTVFGAQGVEKLAEIAKVASKVFHLGSLVVTDLDIEKLAGSDAFAEQFPASFVNQFKEAPVAVFNSLPKDTQVSLAKIAKKC